MAQQFQQRSRVGGQSADRSRLGNQWLSGLVFGLEISARLQQI